MNLPSIILVISGASSIERRSFMNAQLIQLSIPYKYIDASFPFSYSPDDNNQFGPYARQIRGKAEQGCAMSHIDAYQYIVENSIDSAIILEDDAELATDFEACISNIQNICFDVCLLGISKLTRNEFRNYQFYFPMFNRIQQGNYQFGKSFSRRFGTVAYAITLKGAEKIISCNNPPKVVADNWAYFEKLSSLNVIEVRPLIAFERWDCFGSLIDIDRGNKQIGILSKREKKPRGIAYWMFRTFKGHLNLFILLLTAKLK